MAAKTQEIAVLNEKNYEKGMLIDDEWMAGVSRENGVFSVFIVDHLQGAALCHESFPAVDAALHFVNSISRPWRYESTSGCSGDRCEEGKCKGTGCKIYSPPKNQAASGDLQTTD
ncbi:MAG: hypothetical protein H7301_05010 [Cryobacterium sp.]|nr:hypothetical protein [Oligoflexia bacterium]